MIVDENGMCTLSEEDCSYHSRTVKQTNADRIRSMTDEELVELFEMIYHSRTPPIYSIDGFCIDDGLRTKSQWLDWLKEEGEI